MTKLAALALCSLMPFSGDDGVAPEWVHLIPDGVVETADGRGPYEVTDAQAVIRASLQAGQKLVLDTNHSTDLAAPKGGDAPARGWIVELQARDNGIWGRVEWTDEGRRMVEAREYRGISPAIGHRKDGTVVSILRASLVNQPNLKGLVALHQKEAEMDFMKKIAKAMGLGEDADEDAILTKLNGMMKPKKGDDMKEALNAALAPIATALGLGGDADADQIVTSINAIQSDDGGQGDVVTSLQADLKSAVETITALQSERKEDKATAFVDGAIREGRVGVKASRDEYIAMHQENPERTEKLINGMPKLADPALNSARTSSEVPADGQDPTAIALQARKLVNEAEENGQTLDFGAAVMRVVEGEAS